MIIALTTQVLHPCVQKTQVCSVDSGSSAAVTLIIAAHTCTVWETNCVYNNLSMHTIVQMALKYPLVLEYPLTLQCLPFLKYSLVLEYPLTLARLINLSHLVTLS